MGEKSKDPSRMFYAGIWKILTNGAGAGAGAGAGVGVGAETGAGKEEAIVLDTGYIFDDVSFWNRSAMREATTFFSRTMCTRIDVGITNVECSGRVCYCLRKANGLCVLAIAEPSYVPRVARRFLTIVADQYERDQPGWMAETVCADNPRGLGFVGGLEPMLRTYSKPEEVDKIARTQTALNETREVLVKTMELLLTRGETLESLSQKSQDLSKTSKVFFTKAKVGHESLL